MAETFSSAAAPPTSSLDLHATLFRGLADPARLALLRALRPGPQPAGELARRCGLSPSNTSNHLQCLLECGLVRVEPRGRHNLYRLADVAVAELLDVSQRLLATSAGALIEACRNYGAPSRRALRLVAREPDRSAWRVAAVAARGGR